MTLTPEQCLPVLQGKFSSCYDINGSKLLPRDRSSLGRERLSILVQQLSQVQPTQQTVANSNLHIGAVSHRPARQIVVGVDGSAGSIAAVHWAAVEAGRRGALLRMVAVWEEAQPAMPDGPLPRDLAECAATRLQEALDCLVRTAEGPRRVICAMRRGNPAVVLEAEARMADLLVLGTSGHTAAAGQGTIVMHCLRHVRTPLVLVRATSLP